MTNATRISAWGPPLLRRYSVAAGIATLSIVIQLTQTKSSFQYDFERINDGAWWLLLTGHLAHLGWKHLLVNLVALFLIWELFPFGRSMPRDTLIVLLLCVCVSLGLYTLDHNVLWYVGLSGVLHGLFAVGIVQEMLSDEKRMGPTLASLVMLGSASKLAWEQIVGAMPTGIGGEDAVVIVDAHLYGAFTGAIIALTNHILMRIQR